MKWIKLLPPARLWPRGADLKGTKMDGATLIAGRERLLSSARQTFAADARVTGVFLGGSLAAGSADAYSDIDLRVVVQPDAHADFVARRREIPKQWPCFLFNEWMPGTQHCVSHFKPFTKIDIFYLDQSTLAPSPWYGLPIEVLHDPSGAIATLLAASASLPFTVAEEEVDRSISKGIAAAHEVYRRASRGELLYARALLDELRLHIMKADDWLAGRTPLTAVYAKFEHRGSPAVLEALMASLRAEDAATLGRALGLLVNLYRGQVTALHEKFRLSRPLENDLAALELVG